MLFLFHLARLRQLQEVDVRYNLLDTIPLELARMLMKTNPCVILAAGNPLKDLQLFFRECELYDSTLEGQMAELGIKVEGARIQSTVAVPDTPVRKRLKLYQEQLRGGSRDPSKPHSDSIQIPSQQELEEDEVNYRVGELHVLLHLRCY